MNARLSTLCAAFASLACAGSSLAWDAHGHRTITLLALDAFEKSLDKSGEKSELAWLLAPESRAQAGYQSGEPDRYRAIRSPQLKHENDPEHYIDLEDLEQFGLTFRTIPPLRTEYLRAMMIAKHVHPEGLRPYNEKSDTAKTTEFPGELPFSISEHYWKLVSSFRQIRLLDKLNDSSRSQQLAAARANVIFEMGQLSHFVGDAAQPLHTTRHHHGWVDDNPDNFTTNRGFHAYIDTTVLGMHTLKYDTLKGTCTIDRTVNPNDPWNDTLDLIERSFEKVRPLYALQKSGDLDKEPGKQFIQERLCDGASTLGAYYLAAWKASAATDKDVQDFVNYDHESSATPNPMDAAKRPTP